MPRSYVVLDANAYRNIGRVGARDMKGAERGRSMVAVAHTGTVAELLAHVAEEDDEDFRISMQALRVLWEHCSLYNGSTHYVPLLHTESLKSVLLFGQDSQVNERQVFLLHAVLRDVICGENIPAHIRPALRSIAARVALREAEFVGHFVKYAETVLNMHGVKDLTEAELSQIRSARREFFRARAGLSELAKARVVETAERLNLKLDPATLEGKSEQFTVAFPTAMEFFSEFARRVIIDRADPVRRGNSLWDYELAHAASSAVSYEGAPVRLVTGDRELLTAAQNAGGRDRVLTLEEHRTSLN